MTATSLHNILEATKKAAPSFNFEPIREMIYEAQGSFESEDAYSHSEEALEYCDLALPDELIESVRAMVEAEQELCAL